MVELCRRFKYSDGRGHLVDRREVVSPAIRSSRLTVVLVSAFHPMDDCTLEVDTAEQPLAHYEREDA